MPQAALNLEGMTGYWMTPSAWTLEPDEAVLSVNQHKVGGRDGGFEYLIGAAPLPHFEAVARYSTLGVRDLSFNGKLGYGFFEGTNHPLGLAVGMQDAWGGARLFHAKYAVVTQRWSLMEASLGWGNGASEVEVTRMGTGMVRLGGWFWGGQLELPLPDSQPVRLFAMHDYDGQRHVGGMRAELRLGETRVQVSGFRDWKYERWDFATSVSHSLPRPTPARPMDSLSLVRLRAAPWMQTFLGTEVGELDIQAALDLTGIVQPSPWALGHGRLRTRFLATRNFQDGRAFGNYRQEPQVWLEGAGVGIAPMGKGSTGIWVQGGVVDGSWTGANFEVATLEPGYGFKLGGFAGAWYSTVWHDDRFVSYPWLDWNSKDRSWFAKLDAGRYWNQDHGGRVRIGRRFARLSPSAGLSRTAGIFAVDGRIDIELDGIGWRPFRGLVLEPAPRMGHGLQSIVAERNGEGNPLVPGLAKDAPLALRARDGSWP